MTLKLIPAGEFLMGSPDNDKDAENDEKPQHRVRITRAVLPGRVRGDPGAVRSGDGQQSELLLGKWWTARTEVAGQSTDQYPVENVSWLDAVKFCNKLSEKEGRRPFYEIDGENVRVPDWNGPGYRLPTEAEWEYACRANASTPTRYSFGDDAASLGEYGWFDRATPAARPIRWARSGRMGSGCMTCTGTCGSGAGTGMARAITRSLARTIRGAA